MENTFLKHHGVIGMKWGVRRSRKNKSQVDIANKKAKDSRKHDMKYRRTLSTDTIKKKIERLKLDRELKNLTQEDIAPGKKFCSDILRSVGKKTASIVLAGATSYGIYYAMNKKGNPNFKFNWSEAAKYVAPNPNKK